MKIRTLLVAGIMILCLLSCGDDKVLQSTIFEAVLPEVTTSPVTEISETSATSGGIVTKDGGAGVSSRGVVWNTSQNPTGETNQGMTADGSGTGSFISNMTGLNPGTTYYVRAYAINSQGTSYGEQTSFTTRQEVSVDWPRDTDTEVVEVTSVTGRTWMDRNLGASRAAASSNDSEAYGDLYQWGRAADDHQRRNSPLTSTLSSTNRPGHGSFILAPHSPGDWRSPENDNLWQGVDGINNPCPTGFRLPTEAEWNAERQSWNSSNATGAFASPLKLPMAGFRLSSNIGSLSNVGSGARYWSSTVSGSDARDLSFNSIGSGMTSNNRAFGFSVRCLKDGDAQAVLPELTTTPVTEITENSATSGGEITNDGGAAVTSRGVVWGTSQNPTVDTNQGMTADGSGTGSFISNMTGLNPGTTYYVRAYAINSQGTGYGEQTSFTTRQEVSVDWPRDTQTAVVQLRNPATGRIWMDRNLGASRTAISSTDSEAYGDLYQWGRPADGHQKRNSTTTSTLSSSDQPGHGSFIHEPNSPGDWRSPQNDNLWQGEDGANNPCPDGYRLPTEAEWDAERNSWGSNNSAGAFATPLKLPMAGYRGGSLGGVGYRGDYWSSTVSGSFARGLGFGSDGATTYGGHRSIGNSVRCLKD